MPEAYLAPDVAQLLVESVPASLGSDSSVGWRTVLDIFLRISSSPYGCIALVKISPGRNYDWLAVHMPELVGDSEPIHLPGNVRSKVQQDCMSSRKFTTRNGVVQGFRSGKDFHATVFATPIVGNENVLGFAYGESHAVHAGVDADRSGVDPVTMEAFGRLLGALVYTRLQSQRLDPE